MNRRQFLKKTSLTTASLYLAPKFAIGKAGPSANSRVNVACVGIGNMGSVAVRRSLEENIVALCDVDWRDDWGKDNNPNAVAAEVPAARKFEDFRVTVPTCVIWGMDDTALRPSLLDGLDEVVDDLTLHRIEGCGHWVFHQEPDRVNGLIRDFLAK